jgi:heme A synthase
MELLHPLLMLLLIVVAIAIIWWALQQAPIPAPFRWITNVILAIVALIVLFEFVAPMIGAGSGGSHLR